MKFNKIILGIICTIALTLTSCYDEKGDDYAPAKPESGAFLHADATSFVYAADDEQVLTLSLGRTETNDALTVGISSDNATFNVPSSISFAAGEEEKQIQIPFNMKGGTTEEVTFTITEGGTVYGLTKLTFNITRENVWEYLGVGYWVDGIVSTLFGVDPTIAYCSNIYRTETADGLRYRFDMPYSHVATGDDGVGYWGYVYNDPGDCDEKDYTAVVDIRPQGAYFNAMSLGFDWGYGEFSIAPTAYGEVTEDALIFAPGSLRITMADWGSTSSAEPCYLFFSADAYIAWYMEQ